MTKKKDYCETCALNRYNRNRVHSQGDFKTAKVIFVGEAPGRREDEEGLPFVGQAGQVLRECLEEVGIEEKDVVFSNVCRCRPPSNRNPSQKEMNRCIKYLKEELEEFDGLIVLLGAVPMKAFLNKKGVLNNRGYGFMKDGRHFFVTYHPSYVLRNRGNKEIRDEFVEDLGKVRTWMNGIEYVPFTKIENWEGLDKFIEKAKKAKYISFDIETNGLDPYAEGAKILSIAFSWGKEKDENYFIPLAYPGSPFEYKVAVLLTRLEFLFNDQDKCLIGQNPGFDIKWIKKHAMIEVTNLWFDTKFASYLINGKWKPQNLKSMVWKYLDYGGYGIDRDGLENEDIERLAKYNVMDAFCTLELVKVFMDKLSDKQFSLMTETMSGAISALAEMEAVGLTIAKEELEEMSNEYYEKLTELEEKMHKYPKIQEYERKNKELINFNSTKQLVKVYDILGIHPDKKTLKTDEFSTDVEALNQVKGKHKFFDDLLEYRKAVKIYSTYLHPYMEEKAEAVRTSYNTTFTVTGRLSSNNPNLQNIPYGVRPVFTASQDFLVEIDYSQLELRVLAMYSKDEALIDAFRTGKDIHEVTRFEIYGDNSKLPDDKQVEQRVQAKTVNFGIVYGISEYGLAHRLELTEEKAGEMIKIFLNKYKGVAEFNKSVKKFVRENGYYETFFGRVREFDFNNPALRRVAGHSKRKMIDSLYREAVNFPIQSTARDLVFDAQGRLWKEMRKREMDSRMIADVHDSILFDVRDKELEELLVLAKGVMEDFSEFDFVNVPVKIDIKIGEFWGKLEEFEI